MNLKRKVYKSSPFDDGQSYLIWIHVFSIFDFYHETMTDDNPSKTDDYKPLSPSRAMFFINQNVQKFVVESIKFARQSPPLSRHTKCKRYHLTIKRIRQFPISSSGTVLWKTFVMFFHHNTFIHKLLLILKISFKQASYSKNFYLKNLEIYPLVRS